MKSIEEILSNFPNKQDFTGKKYQIQEKNHMSDRVQEQVQKQVQKQGQGQGQGQGQEQKIENKHVLRFTDANKKKPAVFFKPQEVNCLPELSALDPDSVEEDNSETSKRRKL